MTQHVMRDVLKELEHARVLVAQPPAEALARLERVADLIARALGTQTQSEREGEDSVTEEEVSAATLVAGLRVLQRDMETAAKLGELKQDTVSALAVKRFLNPVSELVAQAEQLALRSAG